MVSCTLCTAAGSASTPRVAGDGRQLLRQLQVEVAHPGDLGGEQPHGDRPHLQVDVRVVAQGISQPGDLVDQLDALGERPGAEAGARAYPHLPPVLHAVGLLELPG